MSEHDCDLFVLGAGSGGVRAGRFAARYGAKVIVAERAALGGTCVNVGCIPKKLLVYGSRFAHEWREAAGYGWSVTPPAHDWATLIANKDAELRRLNGIYGRLFDGAGVEVVRGVAKIVDPHTVEVDGKRYRTRYILVAVGGWPFVPEVPGAELGVTSNEALSFPEQPKRLLVVGGGYIGVELACIFAGFGSQVTLSYRGPLFLRGFDDDIRNLLAEEVRRQGIDLRFDDVVTGLRADGEERVATFADGREQTYDQVLWATGRRPRTQRIGLEEAGVELDERGAVRVDRLLKTNVDSIYALGDVTDRITLTPMALAEGMAVAATLFDGRPTEPDYDLVPSAIFSHPEAATVGMTEGEARAAGHQVKIFRSNFRALKHTLSGAEERTMTKLVVDAQTDRVLGAHMVGIHAGDVLQGFAVAMRCGATKAQLDATIGIHPTAAEEFVTMRQPVAD